MTAIASMHPYATHLVPLMTSAIRSGLLWPKSSILELGCGHYSTPLLASIAKTQERKFQLITSGPEWAKQFEKDPEDLLLIDSSIWPEILFQEEFGMVFIDNEELVLDRYLQLFKLNERAKVVVFHDANCIESAGVSWDLVSAFYQHIYFYNRYFPTTAILSNEVDPKTWFDEP